MMKSREIAELRAELKVNKTQFGALFGVHGSQVLRWEDGRACPPKAKKERLFEIQTWWSSASTASEKQAILAELFGTDKVSESRGEYGVEQTGKFNVGSDDKTLFDLALEKYHNLPVHLKVEAEAEFVKAISKIEAKNKYGLNDGS